jgi:hypothetical protein
MEMTPEELDEQFEVHDEEIWDSEPVEVGGWDEANALESAGFGEDMYDTDQYDGIDDW